jgi:hypothetical protein
MTRLSTALARLGRALVTVALVLFAAWTVAYEVALLTGLSAAPTLLLGMVGGAVVLVVLHRLDGGDREHLVPLPGPRTALLVLAATLVATALSLSEHRRIAVALAVVGAAAGLVDMVRCSRRERSDSCEPGDDEVEGPGDSLLWVFGWAAALVSGALAAVIARPDGDDAYFVNLSTWVAERGSFPLGDTMISPDQFPALSSHSPPIHSVEALIGTIARLLDIEAGTAAYVLVPPVATVLGVLVLTWLVEAARIPAAPAGLLAAVSFLWTTGGSGYSFGSFFAVRIWQGKAMLVALVLPLVLLLGARLLRRGDARHHVLFVAAVIASLGTSNTATFVVPVMMAGLVVAGLALRQVRGALRVALWVSIPLVAGLVSVLLAPESPTRDQLLSEGFAVRANIDVVGQTRDPLATVPGSDGILALTVLAIGVGLLGMRALTLRTAILGVLLTGGISLLPPFRHVFDVLGLGSVLWRMWWIIPVPLLVAGLVGAVAGRVPVPRTRAIVAVPTAVVVALVPLLGGWWVGDRQSGSRIVKPMTWKVPRGALAEARFVEHVSRPGDIALVPWDTSRVLAALTVDVQPVAARRGYLRSYAGTSEALAGSREVLQEFVDRRTPDTDTIGEHLDAVGVDTACVGPSRGRAVDLLETNGYRVVGRVGSLVCLRR